MAKRCTLLEYDRRFSVYDENYVFYDLNEPLGGTMQKYYFYANTVIWIDFISSKFIIYVIIQAIICFYLIKFALSKSKILIEWIAKYIRWD